MTPSRSTLHSGAMLEGDLIPDAPVRMGSRNDDSALGDDDDDNEAIWRADGRTELVALHSPREWVGWKLTSLDRWMDGDF